MPAEGTGRRAVGSLRSKIGSPGYPPVGLNSVATLTITPLDTDGRFLRLRTDSTEHRAVASLDVHAGPVIVRLEILSASHRVTVVDAGSGSALLTETVACEGSDEPEPDEPAGTNALAPEHSWRSGGWSASFRSTITTGCAAVESAALCISGHRDDERLLIRRFPGHPLALTAVRAETTPGRQSATNGDTKSLRETVGWRTWHLYPGPDPHVVTTVTRATLQEDRL